MNYSIVYNELLNGSKEGEHMKSITIHGIDNELTQLISNKAQQHGMSLNKTIKMLLRQSLGIASDTAKKRQAAFADIFGVWSKADEKAFANKTKGVERIEREDWL